METFSTFKQDELSFVLHKIYFQTAKILETEAIVHVRIEKEHATHNFGIFEMIVKNSNIIVDNILKLLPKSEGSKYPYFDQTKLLEEANHFLESDWY